MRVGADNMAGGLTGWDVHPLSLGGHNRKKEGGSTFLVAGKRFAHHGAKLSVPTRVGTLVGALRSR